MVRKEKVVDYSFIANKINSNSKKFMEKMDSSFFQIGSDGAILNMEVPEEVKEDEKSIDVSKIETTSEDDDSKGDETDE